MNDLDRYLDRATRGLPKTERLRIREELQGSVLERAAEHQITGVGSDEALHLALREFGDPAPLASGLRRIHLWPRVGLFGGMSSAALALGLLTVLPSLAQPVTVTTQGLIARCGAEGPPPGERSCSQSRTFWVSLDSLRARLGKQGATLTTVTRSFPNPEAQSEGEPATLKENFLRVAWSDSGGVTGRFEVPITDARFDAFTRRFHRDLEGASLAPRDSEQVFTRDGQTFLDGQGLLEALRSSTTRPLTIERPLDGPVVQVGRPRLAVGQPGRGIAAGDLVERTVTGLLVHGYGATTFVGGGLLPGLGVQTGRVQGYGQRVRVRGQPGDLYVVVRPMTQPGRDTQGLGFDVVTVGQDGHIVFRTAQPRVRYTSNVRALAQSGSGKAAVALLHLGSGLRWEAGGPLRHRVEVP
ncbi:permease prefix domain 1-containing protein [Deinococcus sp. MIMF12]|uniref:Permease prefix domain 1-containing protein n=1 Tax=Deinococcus rhizophilus TaxID=3049544 RepID=A0ABT7JFF0_9DEIO|nr:permease prefix domain 1-containing protein [Deinococcus rhizophilus]MDL2343777.1 permease prefix domain 1-containing protein [Deinococcus rhizophilus]